MTTIKRELDGKVVTILLSLLIAVAGVGIAQQGDAGSHSYVNKTGATLEFLIKSGEKTLDVSIRFTHELDKDEIFDLEAQGLTFVRVNGEVAHSGTIYGAKVSLDMLETLKASPNTVRIESARGWAGAIPTLDESVPEINAGRVWNLKDTTSRFITGKGIIVADFDSGIDVFHPDFWKADGPSYNWIDTNSNSTFDPGTDAVDLNRNSTASPGEILNFFDAEGPKGNDDGIFQADMDWLYNDANNNGQRDYGTGAGFTEADPTFGELIFVVDDTDGDNKLDVGESLIALGTSKVRKTLNDGKIERTRGTDLISTQDDEFGHGTSVCGIINGGVIGKRKYVGVAPDAELLVVNKYSDDYGETFYIPWARINGADVMLYEFGEFVLKFLDGSSNFETMIDNEASQGIVQVAAAGNLGVGDNDKPAKHAQHDVGANDSTDFPFNVPTIANKPVITKIIITVLWRTTSNDLSFALTIPTIPKPVSLSPTPSGWQSEKFEDEELTISYHREDSTRGTAKYDIIIIGKPVSTGGWTLSVTNNAATNEHVDVYIYNNAGSKWGGGAVWTDYQDNDENTVSWPATADSAITVAAYNTRGGSDGDLKSSSSVGPRVDGQAVVDIAAPGNWSWSALSKDKDSGGLGWYDEFNGTSAAAPHVAGASALLLQSNSSLDHQQIKLMLQQSARADSFTHPTPNNKWGYGKLDLVDFPMNPTVWVDFQYKGAELGTFMEPFDTLAEGISAVSQGGSLTIKDGSTTETPTITKPLTIRKFGGNVIIGR